jgi:hypothetical protein
MGTASRPCWPIELIVLYGEAGEECPKSII